MSPSQQGQKDRRAPNRRPDAAQAQQRRADWKPGKKKGSAGGAGSVSGSTGRRGQNSPK